uniref:NADH dehydrogenase subunit 4L n=1 Tax=Metacrangonyx goulmimensis TaxID=1199162 RepID=K7ZVW3_9CRUS|nr:NADH dehydrogenase subunit 4L [Metacrangonyx goulmimensis]
MLMINLVVFFGLILNLIKFMLNNMYMLISLLSLEYISLLMYCFMSMNLVFLGLEMYYLLYFLVMMTCEGVLGLSILVIISFSHSVNFMKWYNSASC